jgi:hypothetical protein
MDQSLVELMRKKLESTSTEDLTQASADHGGKSPEELEAIRQILRERAVYSPRAIVAPISAVVVGALMGVAAWWQEMSPGIIVVACVVGAVLGFSCWYVSDLIPRT